MKARVRKLLRGLAVLLGVLVLAFIGVWLWLYRGPWDGKNPPRGYGSMKQIAVAVGLGALQLVDLNPALPANVLEIKGIEYGRVGDRPLLLDLYEPRNRAGNRLPGLLFRYGGAWRKGMREDHRSTRISCQTRGVMP